MTRNSRHFFASREEPTEHDLLEMTAQALETVHGREINGPEASGVRVAVYSADDYPQNMHVGLYDQLAAARRDGHEWIVEIHCYVQ